MLFPKPDAEAQAGSAAPPEKNTGQYYCVQWPGQSLESAKAVASVMSPVFYRDSGGTWDLHMGYVSPSMATLRALARAAGLGDWLAQHYFLSGACYSIDVQFQSLDELEQRLGAAAKDATPFARYAYGTLLNLNGLKSAAVSLWLMPEQCDESVIALIRRDINHLNGQEGITDHDFDAVLQSLVARGRTVARITQAWSMDDTTMMAQICDAIQEGNDPYKPLAHFVQANMLAEEIMRPEVKEAAPKIKRKAKKILAVALDRAVTSALEHGTGLFPERFVCRQFFRMLPKTRQEEVAECGYQEAIFHMAMLSARTKPLFETYFDVADVATRWRLLVYLEHKYDERKQIEAWKEEVSLLLKTHGLELPRPSTPGIM